MSLAENLKVIRKKWGDNQADFAARFGVSRTLVSKWELGETEPGLKVLIWLEDQTGIPMRTIIEGELLSENVGNEPGELIGDVLDRENSKLKMKISDLVMELDESEKSKGELLKALITAIELLEKDMDKSVYAEEKKGYLERMAALMEELR